MNECPIYMYLPGSLPEPTPPAADEPSCGGCSCGYLQYESLIPYLKEIRLALKLPEEDGVDFEFKLRELIVEVSRLFDIAAGVTAGYFSKAHYFSTKVYSSNRTQFIKVPEHVAGTLELRTIRDELIDPSYYEYKDGHLVFRPCVDYHSCGCYKVCGHKRLASPKPWPETCYKVSARWGKECSDLAVQKAVRDYIIETFRMQDPVIQLASGISIQRSFKVPHSWELYISNFKAKRKIFNNFAIA